MLETFGTAYFWSSEEVISLQSQHYVYLLYSYFKKSITVSKKQLSIWNISIIAGVFVNIRDMDMKNTQTQINFCESPKVLYQSLL